MRENAVNPSMKVFRYLFNSTKMRIDASMNKAIHAERTEVITSAAEAKGRIMSKVHFSLGRKVQATVMIRGTARTRKTASL